MDCNSDLWIAVFGITETQPLLIQLHTATHCCHAPMQTATQIETELHCVLNCDGTRAETRFHLSLKRMSPFKSAGASVQSTTGSRVVRISGSNAGYTMFRGSVKSTVIPRLTSDPANEFFG